MDICRWFKGHTELETGMVVSSCLETHFRGSLAIAEVPFLSIIYILDLLLCVCNFRIN